MTSRTLVPVETERGDGSFSVAIFRVQDVIDVLAESFPEQVLNLPPRPHQKMRTPEGA